MPVKRRRQIMDKRNVGTYHCFTRCVRRAFLAGVDWVTGKDFSYRKDWIRERLEALASVFAVDVLDHAVMENHLHVILRNRPDVAKRWRRREVVRRWLRLSRKSLRLKGEPSDELVNEVLKERRRVGVLRRRLSDISWFMLMLKEPVSLQANEEDKVSGCFWAERFGSVKLESDESLLLCSLYVDLNPIRSGRARTPEESTYTGACDRLRDLMAEQREQGRAEERRRVQEELARERENERTLRRVLGEGSDGLEAGGELEMDVVERLGKPRSGWMTPMRVEGDGYRGAERRRRASNKGYLPMDEVKYLQLLDAMGREQVDGKRGAIPATLPPILERLKFDPALWSVEATLAYRRFARIAVQCAQQKAERQSRRPRRKRKR
ncbi:MAG: hypothetical protein U0939_06885 [Pirellulales bacterium]